MRIPFGRTRISLRTPDGLFSRRLIINSGDPANDHLLIGLRS